MPLLQRTLVGALLGLCVLVAAVASQAATDTGATDTGVYVEYRESDQPGAPVVDRWRLYGASYALVIGIDNYSNGWPRLSNAVKDAELVAEGLRQKGFEVELLTDVDGVQLRESLRRFFAYKGKDPQARLFVWYAGHGHSENGEGYLVPADAPLPGNPDFNYTALHMGDVGSMVRIARSKHVLAVFDSCFSGTIFSNQRARPPTAITAAVKRPVRQFLTSGDAEQEVSDDGTFRTLFLRALRGEETADANRDGYLTGTELSFYLEDRVINLTQGIQTPRGGKLRDPKFDQGDFVFLMPNAPAAPGAETAPRTTTTERGEPGPDALEVTFWKSIEGSQTVSDFEAYLQRFPQGTFVELAQSRMDTLAQIAALQAPPVPTKRVTEMNATFVTLRNVNLREGPSTETATLGRVASGRGLTVTGKVQGGNWYRVRRGDQEAYVFGDLIAEIDSKELVIWELARETGDPAHYAAYVQRYPQGHFAAAARDQAAQPAAESVSANAAATPAETQLAVGVFPNLPALGTSFSDCDGCPEMVVVLAGRFRMGSPDGEDGRMPSEGPASTVTIARPFAIGRHEITRDQWMACVRENGCDYVPKSEPWETGRHPAMRVSWSDAQQYMYWMADKTGKDYRLPTESEWEFAARAGSNTSYWWGDDFGRNNANCKVCGSRWDRKQTAPVGSFKANRFGLHDTAGNLWEWTEDCWHDGFSGAPTDGRAWLKGGNCSYRVLRGGSWLDHPRSLRSAARTRYHSASRHEFVGFRVALTLAP